MRKQRIRLSEGDLHRIVRQCVNEAVNELDARTYASYADKRQAQGQTDKARQGRQAAVNAWNNKYGHNYLSKNKRGILTHDSKYMDDDYNINNDIHAEDSLYGDRSYTERLYNPNTNTIDYHLRMYDKNNVSYYDDNGQIDAAPYDDYEERKVARQMAQGNGKYVKGQGWQ